MSRNLTLRILSALVLIPLVITAIYMGDLVFDAFMLLAFVLSVIEWRNITRTFQPKYVFLGVGILYFLISLFLFDQVRDGLDGLYLTVTLMFVVWASDTVAYIFGRTIGGPKLAPSISPNKTWAGLLGSMVGAAVIFYTMMTFNDAMPSIFGTTSWSIALNPVLLVVYGAIFGVVGQVGDLAESYMKRKAGMKDSGNLIPGHGGILDRIDALLLVIPVFYFVTNYGF